MWGEKVISKFFDRIGSIMVRLIVVLVLLFMVLPLVIQFVTSFSSTGLTFSNFSLENYAVLFSREEFIRSLTTSIMLAIYATVISLAIGIPCSISMVRHQFKGKNLLDILFITPYVIPGIVAGMCLLNIFILLKITGLPQLLLAHIILTFPYVMRTLQMSLIGFDRSLEEAAMSLGADEVKTFTKITFPMIKPGVLAAVVLAFQASFNNIAISIFLTSPTTNTVPIVLMSWMQRAFDPGVLAGSGAIFIGTALFILITEKLVGIDKLVGVA